MGYYLSKMWKRLINKGERDFKIIIVGLHNAGKTTILYKLALNEVVVTQPTIGSNVEEVTHQNVKLQVWDLGGQESLRAAWDAYYENAEAVIYVVDAAESDSQNLLLSKMEFFNLLYHNDLKDAVVLVLANKIDLPTARDAGGISDLFGLHEIKDHDWHVQGCCAITGEGLDKGLDWLTSKLNQKSSAKLQDGTLKKVTKLPDHDMKPKLTDLTIRENTMRVDTILQNANDIESNVVRKKQLIEEEKKSNGR